VKRSVITVRVRDTYYASFQLVKKPWVSLISSCIFLLSTVMKTVSSMSFFFLALTLFPHVQRRAQAELDAVVGRDRLPTFDDRPRLPYIEALCKELMRWQVVSPTGTIWSLLWLDNWNDEQWLTGVPHLSSTDDVYRGYFIPEGQIDFSNRFLPLFIFGYFTANRLAQKDLWW
jgi:hypothetical protein